MQNSRNTRFNFSNYSVDCSSIQIYRQNYTKDNCNRKCICGNYNQNRIFQCFKCKQKIHICVRVQINRLKINSFQCSTCLSRCLDLVYKPQNHLLETYYKTHNIFQKPNQITFQFQLKYQQTKYKVDIRSFKGSKTQLNWPMQGQFFLNGSNTPINVCKPLKINSNRKNRKQDPFTIKPQLLKQGKNTLVFKIPKLDRQSFTRVFQFDQNGIYFIGIYSVKQMQKQQVMNITLRQRRHQKGETLKIMQQIGQDLQIEKNKIRFIDPYTCQRINFPVRGKYCKHLTAVCLLIFIQIQKITRSWKCPICGQSLNQPYIDLWMYQMLKSNPQGQGVYIYANGNYEWQEKQKSIQLLSSSDSSNQRFIQSNQKPVLLYQEPTNLNSTNLKFNKKDQHQNIIQQLPAISFLQQFTQKTQNKPIDFLNLMDDDDIQIINPLQQIQQPIRIDIQQNYSNQNNFNEKAYKFGQEFLHQQLIINQERIQQQNFLQDFPFATNYNQSIKIQQAKKKALEKQKLSKSLLNQIQPQKNAQIYLEVQNSKLNISQDQINIIKKNLQSKNAQKVQQFLKLKKVQKQQQGNKSLEIIPKANEFISGNKRMIDRPSFVQQMKQQQKHQNRINYHQNKNISFGKLKKRIQISQMKNPTTQIHNPINLNKSKSQPKKQFQFANVSSRTIKVQSQFLKNNQIKIKQKSLKEIKPLNFQQISHNHFLKKYCKIPLNPYGRIMNQDMRKVFKMIL